PVPPELYTLPLHDALPIFGELVELGAELAQVGLELADLKFGQSFDLGEQLGELAGGPAGLFDPLELLGALGLGEEVRIEAAAERSEEHTSELQSRENLVCR